MEVPLLRAANYLRGSIAERDSVSRDFPRRIAMYRLERVERELRSGGLNRRVVARELEHRSNRRAQWRTGGGERARGFARRSSWKRDECSRTKQRAVAITRFGKNLRDGRTGGGVERGGPIPIEKFHPASAARGSGGLVESSPEDQRTKPETR